MEYQMCEDCLNLSEKSNRHTRPHKNLVADPEKESKRINSAMGSADEYYYVCKKCGTHWLHETGKSTISNFLYDMESLHFNQCSVDGLGDKKILVYNQAFIEDYFYESEDLKGVFSLSKENKEIEEKLAQENAELSILQDEEEDIENKIKIAHQQHKDEKSSAMETT